MKSYLIIAGLLLYFCTPNVKSNFFKDYMSDRSPIKLVDQMPAGTGNLILVISSRNFKHNSTFGVKRGLDPNYKLSYYIAGLKNDSAFLIQLEYLNDISSYLPSGKDFLVLVDGHGKTFWQSMARGFELTDRFNINMIVFDWPSDYLALRKTVHNASEVTGSFVRAMCNVNLIKQNSYPEAAFSVIFHSMGNRIIEDISKTKLLDKMPDSLFSNIIINAAAVKYRNHVKWVERLNIQKRIYITMNERDFNLRGAAVLRLAGQLGITNHNKIARNAYYVNFSELSTEEHNLFLGRNVLEKSNSEVYMFYELAFHGREVILGENTGFQILRPSDKSFLFSER